MDDKLLEWSKIYGLYYTIRVPGMGTIIVVSDPKLFKQVTISKNHPKSPSYQAFLPIVGSRSMLVLEGDEWTPKRKGFSPGFATAFLRNMIPIMTDKLRRFVDCIDEDIAKNAATNTLERTQTFTSDVIVSVAFGEDWGGRDPHPARLWLNDLTVLLAGILLQPMKRLFGWEMKRQIREYERLLDVEMRSILERRLAAGDTADTSKDICSLAIKTIRNERNGQPLTEDDKVSITHQLKTFYFAGHETTASLLAWSVWLLSQDDRVLAAVRAELQEHQIWTNFDQPPTYEALHKCTYLEAVLKETLRLYPPAGIVSRYGDDLDETYEGYQIGGCIHMLAIYTMHHNPALWKNPEAFRPERFLDGSETDLSEKWVPFSRGPRDCIGKHFAMLEAKLALAALCVRYDAECVNPNEKVASLVTYVPQDGAKIRFHRRTA